MCTAVRLVALLAWLLGVYVTLQPQKHLLHQAVHCYRKLCRCFQSRISPTLPPCASKKGLSTFHLRLIDVATSAVWLNSFVFWIPNQPRAPTPIKRALPAQTMTADENQASVATQSVPESTGQIPTRATPTQAVMPTPEMNQQSPPLRRGMNEGAKGFSPGNESQADCMSAIDSCFSACLFINCALICADFSSDCDCGGCCM